MFWITKMFNRAIGEKNYDIMRMERRIAINKFYWNRQAILYE